jgi:hypothetical protein
MTMKKYYVIFFLIIVFSVLTLLLINYLSGDITDRVVEKPLPVDVKDTPVEKSADDEEQLIGGQRDVHGCLGGAGYTFNEEIGACIREWELDQDQRIGAFLVAEQLGRQEGLTILDVTIDDCQDCYTVKLDKFQNHFTVKVVGGEVVESLEKNSEVNIMYGSVEELVLNVSKIAFGIDEDNVDLTTGYKVVWNTPEGEMEYTGIGYSQDYEMGSEESSEVHRMLLDVMNNNGFETDQFNAMSDSKDEGVGRLRKGNFICTVSKEDQPENTTKVAIACVDISL